MRRIRDINAPSKPNERHCRICRRDTMRAVRARKAGSVTGEEVEGIPAGPVIVSRSPMVSRVG